MLAILAHGSDPTRREATRIRVKAEREMLARVDEPRVEASCRRARLALLDRRTTRAGHLHELGREVATDGAHAIIVQAEAREVAR